MKKVFTLLSILFTLNVFANTDTLPKVTIDTAFIPKSAIKISPISLNFKGDSTYSFTWSISGISRDTSVPVILSVFLLDKSGNEIYNIDYPIPSYVVNKGINIAAIDNFILTRNNRFIKK